MSQSENSFDEIDLDSVDLEAAYANPKEFLAKYYPPTLSRTSSPVGLRPVWDGEKLTYPDDRADVLTAAEVRRLFCMFNVTEKAVSDYVRQGEHDKAFELFDYQQLRLFSGLEGGRDAPDSLRTMCIRSMYNDVFTTCRIIFSIAMYEQIHSAIAQSRKKEHEDVSPQRARAKVTLEARNLQMEYISMDPSNHNENLLNANLFKLEEGSLDC